MGKKGNRFTVEHKKKIAIALRGNKNGVGKSGPRGTHHTKEWKQNMSEIMKLQNKKRIAQGNHNFWKGGITPEVRRLRASVEYRLWRESVFKRDNWICIWCKKRGGKLNADHIKPFAYFPELRFAIDNGRTLCEDCHRKTDTFGRKGQIKNKAIIQ